MTGRRKGTPAVGLWLLTAALSAFALGFSSAVLTPRPPALTSSPVSRARPLPARGGAMLSRAGAPASRAVAPASQAGAPVSRAAHQAHPSLTPQPVPTQPLPTGRQAALNNPPLATPAERGRLAVVIDDCGNSYVANAGFLQLSEPITLSVLPHRPASLQVAREARERGMCVLLHLPMEALDGRDPGPGTLKVAMGEAELDRTLEGDLEAVPGIQGVNNHEGSRASADRRVVGRVLDEVARRGLFYLDSRTTGRTVAPELSRERGMKYLSRQVFLDNQDSLQAVLSQLRAAERLAAESGTAIAIGHPRVNTLAALRLFQGEARAHGVRMVPLQDLAGPRQQEGSQ